LTKSAKEVEDVGEHSLRGLFGERNRVSMCALRGDEDKRTSVKVDQEPDAVFDVAVEVTDLGLSEATVHAVIDGCEKIRSTKSGVL
jgi:hypothetical protein